TFFLYLVTFVVSFPSLNLNILFLFLSSSSLSLSILTFPLSLFTFLTSFSHLQPIPPSLPLSLISLISPSFPLLLLFFLLLFPLSSTICSFELSLSILSRLWIYSKSDSILSQLL